MKKSDIKLLEKKNADALAELLVAPDTSPTLLVSITTKLLDAKESTNFFPTIFEENLSKVPCPECGHENHWLIPETELNLMGFVTAEDDGRVKPYTTAADCEKFQEACSKRKVNL